jgi:hypothetical protein
MKSLIDRFDAKYVVDPATGCWEWTAAKYSNGYGVFHMADHNCTAHRAAWKLFRGPVDDALDVCHKCDNKGCVNPDHLFPGTRQENMMDRVNKGRHPRTPNKGAVNGRSKLTDAQVKEIREYDGTHASAARKYGVSETVISGIRKGKYWRHIAPALGIGILYMDHMG